LGLDLKETNLRIVTAGILNPDYGSPRNVINVEVEPDVMTSLGRAIIDTDAIAL
jgi:hypothetical protein